jgi:hypothetical protein
MIVLTKEELEKYNKETDYLFGRMRKYDSHRRFYVSYIVKVGTANLVRKKRTGFLCDMYVDFIEKESAVDYILSAYLDDCEKKNYLNYFKITNNEEGIDKLVSFCNYLILCFKKVKEGYEIDGKKDTYYHYNWQKEKNFEVFQLRDFVESLIIKGDDLYSFMYNKAMIKLMAYILMLNELFIEDVYKPILLSLKDNFAYLYDNYVNNYGEDSVDNFFNPKE